MRVVVVVSRVTRALRKKRWRGLGSRIGRVLWFDGT